MNTKERKELMLLALEYGYVTAKDFAGFLKKYNPEQTADDKEKKFAQLPLF